MQPSFLSRSLCRSAFLIACVAWTGCAGLNNGDALDTDDGGLEGNWEYLVTNAYDARFSGCTGDAVVLEGATFAEAHLLAPICTPSGQLDVVQTADDFQVLAHQVQCSDGSAASVQGAGQVASSELGGHWESTSEQGVSAVQQFSGTVVGTSIELTETGRSFSGSFQGACNLTPPLAAIVSVL